jgi:hypothetical protein
MTRDDDQNQTDDRGPEADELNRRLDQASAELSGRLPMPDQRLDTMFAARHAPLSTDLPATVVAVEPLTPFDPPSGSRRRPVAVTAIAAAFLLLVGLAGYAANRGNSVSPVEVAADSAGSPQQAAADDAPHEDGSDHDGGVDDTAESTVSDGADGHDAEGRDTDDGDGAHSRDLDGQWAELFDTELREQLESLWAENQAWIECVTAAVDTWIDSSGDRAADSPTDGTADRGHQLDFMEECGKPSLGGADGAFVWPDHILPDQIFPGFDFPDFDFPDFDSPDHEFPDFDLPDFCEKSESAAGTAISCDWPPCPTDGEPTTGGADVDDLTRLCLPFGLGPLPGFDQLLPDGWLEDGLIPPGDFDFDFDLDGHDLDELLEEFLPGDWREHLDELEDRFGDLEKHLDELEDRSGDGTDGSGHGRGTIEA